MADDERDEPPREPTAETARKRRRAAEVDPLVEERERVEREKAKGEPEKGRPPGSSRLYRLGRRLLDSGDDVRDIASAVLQSSDRAKTEMVKMVAREVRNYLDELKLKEDVMELVRSHSLEFKISVHLAPLVPEKEPEPTKDLPAPIEPKKGEDAT